MGIVKECIQKDRGISIPNCPVGCDFDVGDDYSFGKFEAKYGLSRRERVLLDPLSASLKTRK